MARRAGLPPAIVDRLSGHSTRVGAAQDMVASGVELPAILQTGQRKTTTMVDRYGERLLPRRNLPACSVATRRRAAVPGAIIESQATAADPEASAA